MSASSRRALSERLHADYAELRQAGVLPVDAGRQIGIAFSTQEKYEAWFRLTYKPSPERLPWRDWHSSWS